MSNDVVNEEQAAYWNADAGDRWVAMQERLDRQIAPLGLLMLDGGVPTTGESVLDIGCGCGDTSLEAARRVGATGRVVGADLSEPMLARAAARAAEEKLDHVKFVQADAQVYDFGAHSFDLMISRFGVMFFEDPVAAFTNIRAALKPAGRLSFACWRPMLENQWMALPVMSVAGIVELPAPPEPGAPGPFAFGDSDRTRSILEKAGFHEIEIVPHDAQISMGEEDLDETVNFMFSIGALQRVMQEANDDQRAAATEAVRKAIEPFAGENGVTMGGAIWVVTARNE